MSSPSLWFYNCLLTPPPLMVFSEPQPPPGWYTLSANQPQVPRGSYMNSEEWPELCEGREHVCSPFASSALSSMAHTWQTDHICWGEERTSQQRTLSTGNVVFCAFQTRCPSHRPLKLWGSWLPRLSLIPVIATWNFSASSPPSWFWLTFTKGNVYYCQWSILWLQP